MRNVYHRTWIMARKLKNEKNETNTLSDLEYGQKTDKQDKRETHIVGYEIWQETLKISVK